MAQPPPVPRPSPGEASKPRAPPPSTVRRPPGGRRLPFYDSDVTNAAAATLRSPTPTPYNPPTSYATAAAPGVAAPLLPARPTPAPNPISPAACWPAPNYRLPHNVRLPKWRPHRPEFRRPLADRRPTTTTLAARPRLQRLQRRCPQSASRLAAGAPPPPTHRRACASARPCAPTDIADIAAHNPLRSTSATRLSPMPTTSRSPLEASWGGSLPPPRRRVPHAAANSPTPPLTPYPGPKRPRRHDAHLSDAHLHDHSNRPAAAQRYRLHLTAASRPVATPGHPMPRRGPARWALTMTRR